MNGNELAAAATAVAMALAAQFDDLDELYLLMTLIMQVGYAIQVIYLQRLRCEKSEKLAPEKNAYPAPPNLVY